MNIIKELRKEKGLSQKELAKAVHVHQTAVSQWETGRHFPDMAQAIELADFFNVTTDYLLGVNGDNTVNKPKKSPSEIQMSDVSYALFGEVHKLTDDEKDELLRTARRMVELRELKEQNRKRQG